MASPVDDKLASLFLSIAAAQSTFSDMLSAVTSIAQSIKDTEAQAAQIEGDIGRSCVNTRDTCVRLLSQAGVVPSVLDRIRNLQVQADSKGNYIRDAQGNFLIQ